MKPVPFALVPAPLWDEVCDTSPQAWLFHRHDWVDIESRRFVKANHSFALMAGKRVVAIQPLYISDHATGTGGETLLHSGIHRHTGLALRPDLTDAESKSARSEAMARVLAVAQGENVDRVQLNSHNLAPENLSPARREIPYWVEHHGFQLGLAFGPNGMAPAPGMSTCNADNIVDLDTDELGMFARLDEACRRAVRKATSLGFIAEVENDAAAVDRYFELARASALRTSEQLPPIDYYRDIAERFGVAGNIAMLFARRGDIQAAGLILLLYKQSANFLAGVSLPEELPNRVNDFLHWSALQWAQRAGLRRYRLGPSFPEVPAQWPIARVSRFKTKFGGSIRPVIQGSLFRRPENYAEIAAQQIAFRCARKEPAAGPQPPGSHEPSTSGLLARRIIEHHLRLMGWPVAGRARQLAILCRATQSDIDTARRATAAGDPVLALCPDASFSAAFGVTSEPRSPRVPCVLDYFAGQGLPRRYDSGLTGNALPRQNWHLRSLHAMTAYTSATAEPVVTDGDGVPVWLWQPVINSGILFVGTDLAADLVRYRQGDPECARERDTRQRWGYAGERPNYLFEPQREGEPAHVRHADEWAWALIQTLAAFCDVKLRDVLPDGARGAVVLTGDDDQASLECYARQLELLGGAPITYFLHPLTKHTRSTLDELRARTRIDFGLHPDALDQPDRYAQRFTEQARWFTALAGQPPQSVRNHGFLNDGYWGHLPSWLAGGIKISTNLPGFDGNVLNGSLLPARVVYRGELTAHWSIVTLIGDGVIFVNDWDAARAARCIHDAADAIRARGIPGVMVINLHPENVRRSEAMHGAALDVLRSGFVAWTLRDCFDWFEGR
ncbi:MAG: GNAT family N-acetyltransferase [Burkholderiales bacterium]|nr:GNAT family N-acetyltransferase [Burkholderiales bacterium]